MVSHYLEADKAMPALICGSFGLMELFISVTELSPKGLLQATSVVFPLHPEVMKGLPLQKSFKNVLRAIDEL